MRTSSRPRPGRRVEALRRGHHHRRPVALEVGEQPAREVLRVVHGQAGDEVERALRLAQEHARDLRQALEEHVAPALVFGDDASRVVRAQLARAQPRPPGPGRARKPALGHLHARPA